MSESSLKILPPYLIFIGSENQRPLLKTALGLLDWQPDNCIGQLRLTDDATDLGIPDLTPSEAADRGAKTLVIGTAFIGGSFPTHWVPILVEALENGLDIASGQHRLLTDEPNLRATAERLGRRLHDVRVPPKDLPVGTGKKRSGRRLLTVGTDCAVGKKYTALAIAKEMRLQNFNADFRASGQTGILITGEGIPIDAVVSDFISGAAEVLSPTNTNDHWDIIEGQGSLYHPGYAGVALGLLHGSQPDAIVLCHDPSREHLVGYPEYPLPPIEDCIQRNLEAAKLTNADTCCIGVAVNTSQLLESERVAYLSSLTTQLKLPCVDPMQDGVKPLVAGLNNTFNK